MNNLACSVCRDSKASFICGVCQGKICKKCTEFQDGGTFSFLTSIPDAVRHPHYCPSCFDATVLPARNRYDEILRRAREVLIFDNPRRPLPNFTSLSKKAISVNKCADRPEALLRLGFLAAEQGYNAVIKVHLIYEKVINIHGYQTTLWHVTGFPASVDEKTRVRLQK